MTNCVIELNDHQIRVANGVDILLRSPGYAFIGKDKIEIGAAAAQQARLQPRAAHNRYWKNLNQDPLQYPSSLARHNADLAFAQLLSIHEQAGKPDEVILAVPGTYSKEQLALLLGLVEASPFRAVGLVDAAIAATSIIAGRGHYVHIDLHLHQAVLTRIEVTDRVSRMNVRTIDGAGMQSILDTTAHVIADLFIKESRFDPQHHPETEQALYDQIPACLQALQSHGEVALEIQYQQTQHQATLPAALLLAALQGHYDRIAAAIEPGTTRLISDQAGNLPGLSARLAEPEPVAETNVFQACRVHAAFIHSSGSGLNYVTSLPATTEPVISAVAVQRKPASQQPGPHNTPATHLLHQHEAVPLLGKSLYLSAAGMIDSKESGESHCFIRFLNGNIRIEPRGEITVFVNGRQLTQATAVQAGDIVSFAGSKTEYTFIHVSE